MSVKIIYIKSKIISITTSIVLCIFLILLITKRDFLSSPSTIAHWCSKEGFYNPHDHFTDLQNYIKQLKLIPNYANDVIVRDKNYSSNPTLADVLNYKLTGSESSLKRFRMAIRRHNIYSNDDNLIEPLIQNLADIPVYFTELIHDSEQIALRLELDWDDMEGIFKPMRFPRDHQAHKNHIPFADYDRHHSEIAAFHLDRLLGFNRVMPAVGRVLNFTEDITPYSEDFSKSIFTSPANNVCFFGNCTNYCSILYPVCGKGNMIEGSLTSFAPQFEDISVKAIYHPWRRSETPSDGPAEWQTNTNYCNTVRNEFSPDTSRRLLDLIDLSVFDFIMQNAARHYYDVIPVFGNDSTILVTSNFKGFGKAFSEDLLILAPLIQCCMIRASTVTKLLHYHNGNEKLSEALFQSLSVDPVAPVLWDPYYPAVDRRVEMILLEIRKCFLNKQSI